MDSPLPRRTTVGRPGPHRRAHRRRPARRRRRLVADPGRVGAPGRRDGRPGAGRVPGRHPRPARRPCHDRRCGRRRGHERGRCARPDRLSRRRSPTGRRAATADVPSARSRVRLALRSVLGWRSSGSGTYAGRNHVWIPALGIDRSVNFFSCTSSAYPGDVVYRWGCAGSNNVYLFGHAHSVFKPLHDAYVRGTLRKGMQVIYADGAGKVTHLCRELVEGHHARQRRLRLRRPGHAQPDPPDVCRRPEPVPPDRPPDQGRLSGPRPRRPLAQMTRRSRMRRAMTRRWTWLVPSPISVSLASRMKRSTG